MTNKLAVFAKPALALPLLLLLMAFVPHRAAVHLLADAPAELPKEVARKFRRDAARIALRLSAGGEDFRYLPVLIPRDKSEPIFKALAQVYEKTELGKELVKNNLHTFPSPSIESLIVIYSKSASWAPTIQIAANETGNGGIDQLLSNYKLVIEKQFNWAEKQDAISIRAKEPINMAAIANDLENKEGVEATDLRIPAVQGNDISARRIGSGWELDYQLRFGGNKSHIWKVRSMDDGTVSLAAESGDPVPDYLRGDLSNGSGWQGRK